MVKVTGQGQISGMQWLILGNGLCRVKQRAQKSHYHLNISPRSVCLSVCRIIASHGKVMGFCPEIYVATLYREIPVF